MGRSTSLTGGLPCQKGEWATIQLGGVAPFDEGVLVEGVKWLGGALIAGPPVVRLDKLPGSGRLASVLQGASLVRIPDPLPGTPL